MCVRHFVIRASSSSSSSKPNQTSLWNENSLHLYNKQSFLSKPTIEHIIPRRLFYSAQKRDANNPWNMGLCDALTNSKRSDFKYGDVYRLRHDSYEVITIYDPHRPSVINGYIDYPKRIFYPSYNADFGFIGRSIIHMLSTYPYLYSCLDEIVVHPDILSKWSQYPISDYERHHPLRTYASNHDKH